MSVKAMALDVFFNKPIDTDAELNAAIDEMQSEAIHAGYKLMFLPGRPHPTGHEVWAVGMISYLKDYYMSFHCPGCDEEDWAEQEKYLRNVE